MSRITLSLVTIFAIAVLEFARAENVYSEINEMLSKNKDNPEKVAMLSELNRDSLNHVEQKFLSEFIKLDELREKQGESTPCDRKGHEILRNTYELLRSRPGPTEMDRVLDEYAVEHANACLPTYSRGSVSIAQSFRSELSSALEFFRLIVERRTAVWKAGFKSLNQWQLRFREIGGEGDAQNAHEALVRYAFDNRHPYLRYLFGYIDEQKVTYTKQVHNIYEQALLKPCKRYIEELGPDFFAPAQFDLMTLEGPMNFLNEDKKADFFRTENKSFIIALRDYQFCNALLRADKEGFFEDIMSVVAKATP